MGKVSFEKLPAIRGSLSCLTCEEGASADLKMDRPIIVGFGSAGYSKNEEELWTEAMRTPYERMYVDPPTVRYVEGLARDEPDADWRIYFFTPLYEAEYQRQGDGVWVLVRKGDGFA